ncbi:MAG: hypothetical protein CSA39_01630 [Flavobacteriales bacterium]|nr:MAG: hypothetical protein CSA39_01630 [Flavobacteriales bacterium]
MKNQPANISIASLQAGFNGLKELVESITNTDELQKFILKDCNTLLKDFIKNGNLSQELILEKEASVLYKAYAINYIFPKYYKSFALLCRDIYLETCKGNILSVENNLAKEESDNYFKNSKSLLAEATTTINQHIDEEILTIKSKFKKTSKLVKTTELFRNPWPVYESQLKTILTQIKTIKSTYSHLNEAALHIAGIKDAIGAFCHKSTLFIDSAAQNVAQLSQEELISKEAILQLNNILEINAENHLSGLSERLEPIILKLTATAPPISTKLSHLQVREIDLKVSVQKWIDYKVFPELMDVLALENNIRNILRINITHIKNRLEFRADEETLSSTAILPVKKQIAEFKAEISNKIETLLKDINNELQISNLVRGKLFLDIPVNAAISQQGESLLNQFKITAKEQFSVINKSYRDALKIETDTDLTEVVDCISERMYKNNDRHYDSLFLNRSFIGDLFLVHRKEQENLAVKAMKQWESHFAKSILVYGSCLSGKSTFINYVSKLNNNKHIVSLKPNSTATIDGRKFATTYNLKEALSYIKNNNIKSTRPIVLIDDLELWHDSQQSFLNNVRALIKFIEDESDDILVIASISSLMYQYLNVRFGFKNIFSTTIDVSKASKKEIFIAIMLRHGASQRTLVDDKEEPLSENKIKKIIKKIAAKNSYNLGEILQSWTYNTYVKDTDKLYFKKEVIQSLPEFFTKYEEVILKHILLFKTTTEYIMKQLVVGKHYEDTYKSALKRLINTKVLLRTRKGSLYINPVVIFDVESIILSKNQILTK